MSFATVVEIANPFEPWDDLKQHTVLPGKTIWDWLKQHHGEDFEQFEHPTLCYHQGMPLMREHWKTTVIQPGDIVQFIKVVGDPVSIIIAVVVAVVAVVVALVVIGAPRVPGGAPQADPVFTRKGQNNRIRSGDPIEVAYGRVRLWPSYAARPYNAYEGNDQFQYNLFCLGHGFFDVEEIRIDDTNITSYKEVEYELIPPGGEITMFPDNVVTSAEVGGIELYGPNEEEYDDWVGPYVVNDAYTEANFIEVDIVYPGGLYKVDDGDLENRSVSYQFQARAIDNEGVPIDDWVPLVQYADLPPEADFESSKEYREYMLKVYLGLISPPAELVAVQTYTDTRRTTTPQRLTRRFEVPAGRYEVRGRRTSNASNAPEVADTVQWQALRGFLPSVKTYGSVTMLAMKIRATNNVSDQSRSSINVVATRKLPVYDMETETWSDDGYTDGTGLVATRNPVDAFLDVFRANYGGKLADQFLNLEALMDLKEVFDEREDYFDWIFDQRTTLMEAASAIARVGRAIPMMTGSRVSMVRDEPKTLPTAMFVPDNMVKGSFRNDIKLFEFDGNDCVTVQYVDPITWKDEEVLCSLPGATTDNPLVVKLAGCTNRAQAYREGMFMAANMRYSRENIMFTTGLEGNIPAYGDLVAVGHDVLEIGRQSGVVLDMWVDGTTTVFQLSDLPEFTEEETHVIVLRVKDGSVMGPYVVIAGDTPSTVKSVANLSSEDLTDQVYFDSDHERPLYLFGIQSLAYRDCKVVNLTPQPDDKVEVACVPYNPIIHSYDNLEVPALGVPELPPVVPDLPEVGEILVVTDPDNKLLITVSWAPAYGAINYVVEKSLDGDNWEPATTTPSTAYRFLANAGNLWLRVAAINRGEGPYSEWSGAIGLDGILPAAPNNLELSADWTGTSFNVMWQPSIGANGYHVDIYDTLGGTLLRTTATGYTTNFTYTNAMAVTDGAVQASYHIEVIASNPVGDSTPSLLDVTNDAPATPTGMSSVLLSGTTYTLDWADNTEPDLSGYKVWASDTPGFTPGGGNLRYTGSASTYALATGGTLLYWRVAATDVWGNVSTLSAEQTIVP